MPDPLNARLLFAARTAYLIPPPGAAPLVPPAEYNLRNVAAWTGGPHNIDAALLAEADEGLILAFRGTFPPDSPDRTQTVLDWLNDADAVFVSEPDLPGRLHQGFSNALNILWPALKGTLLERAGAAGPLSPIYLTGHSKGGAIAFLAAMRCRAALAAARLSNPVYVCTFAAARPGDQVFADAFNAAVPHAIRYEYAEDIVPHLAPELALRFMLQKIPCLAGMRAIEDGFASPGDLHYLARGCTPETPPEMITPLLAVQRITRIVECAAKFDFRTIVDDHSIAAQGGYACGVTGGK